MMTTDITVTANAVILAIKPDAIAPAIAAPIGAPAISPGAPAPVSWFGSYRIDVGGKTDDEIAAEVDRVKAHHQAKSDRMNDLAAHTFTQLVVGAQAYQWGATIRECGTDVELLVYGADAGTHVSPKCLPITIARRDVASLPDNATITGIVTAAIAAEQKAAQDKVAQIARLQARLGGM